MQSKFTIRKFKFNYKTKDLKPKISIMQLHDLSAYNFKEEKIYHTENSIELQPFINIFKENANKCFQSFFKAFFEFKLYF